MARHASRLLLGWLLLALLGAGCNPAHGVPIFLWHSVGEGTRDEYDVPAQEFDRELADLEAWGATPITLKQLFDARDGNGTLPPRPVILTFDDGRACQLWAALPLLAKHHMVAETFVVSGFLGADEAHRRVEHDATGDHPYLTWPELRQMAQSGSFVVESHGVSHQRFREVDLAAQKRELVDSREVLRQGLGQPIDFFAYPFGSFTSASRDAAEEAGYRAALSVSKGPGTRYGLLRTSLHRDNRGVLRAALREAFGAPLHPLAD